MSDLASENGGLEALFDADWYLRAYPDVADANLDPLEHFLQHGEREGRDPSAVFSTSYYRKTFMQSEPCESSPLRHFLEVGRSLGHDPDPSRKDESPAQPGLELLFDADWYLRTYPDVAGANLDPLGHFLQYGEREGRDPSANFSTNYYRETFMQGEPCERSPLRHFLEVGRSLGHDPDPSRKDGSPAQPGLESLFDAAWYLRTYPDVAGADIDPLVHYLAHGEKEGRNPSANFATSYYRTAFMRDQPSESSPLRHFFDVGRALGYDPNPSLDDRYSTFVAAQELSYSLEAAEILNHIEIMTIKPRFLVVVDTSQAGPRADPPAGLDAQIYSSWAVCASTAEVLDHGPGTTERPTFILWLEAGDCLHSSALYCFASAINADPDLVVAYSDEDERDVTGSRKRPFFKPDWSPDYLESCNYLGPSACIRVAAASEALKVARTQYDLLLRVTETSKAIVHVAKVLLHRAKALDSDKPEAQLEQDAEAIGQRLRRTKREGRVVPIRPHAACFRVTLDRASTPLVSVVIPTAGKIADIGDRKVDLILNCLDGLRHRSSYANLEIIVVDNGDIPAERMALIHDHGAISVTYEDPDVNIARKLNLGARHARGDVLLLLNDDVEPLADDWIERLLDQLDKPHVGAVGARLLFPSLKTQHVGVTLHAGLPSHVRNHYPQSDEGYFFSSCAARNYIAVTGAAMMCRTSAFWSVHGYTEDLAIDYNDIDFCLKLRERGLYTVYAPQAELIHYESISRGRSARESELDYFLDRWSAVACDPFYNAEMLNRSPARFIYDPLPSQIG